MGIPTETYSIAQTSASDNSTFDAKVFMAPDSVAITLGAWQQACRTGAAQLYKGPDGGFVVGTADPNAGPVVNGTPYVFGFLPGVNAG